MNYNITITLLLIGFLPFACNKKSIPSATAEVVLLGESNGVIRLRSMGYGNTDTERIIHAKQNAFETLFYRGIPGSQQNTPMISTKENENTSFNSYHAKFMKDKRYDLFITEFSPNYDYEKHGNVKKFSIDMSLNLVSLRSDLENSGVIRKFGY